MEKYAGSGNGGVSGYEVVQDGVILAFKDGSTYFYNHIKPGKAHVAKMIALALQGQGLTTYVNQYVRADYYKKLK